MQPTRRGVLAASGAVLFAGCASSGDGDEGVQIEYSIGEPTSHEDVPEEVVENTNQDGFSWYAVSVDVQNGEISAADLIGLTQLEVGDVTEAARGVQSDGGVASDESSDLSVADSGDVFYRVSADASGDVAWVTDQLEREHSALSINS